PFAASIAGAAPLGDVRTRVSADRREVVIETAPLHVPEAVSYSHHPSEERLEFAWPVDGWVHGYQIDLVDAAGRPLARTLLHHAGVANLGRRQLAYPTAERLFAVGRETRPVALPDSMGVPLVAGERLLLYFALVNETATPVDDARLRVRLNVVPRGEGRRPQDVFPLVLDANPQPIAGGSRAFDVPPGLSATSSEFRLPMGGHLRAMGAHLHDHAVEIRLEDVLTGRVLARLATQRDAAGRLISVDDTRFLLKRRGQRLDAGRPYRVVAVYDNPTAETIRHGAMAYLAGPFVPDDAARWPALDASSPDYQRDLSVADAHAGHIR
ncbi:MAG: hypothetical protein ABW221_00130, partial [Vicinamibacteria bacterium]